MLDIKTLPLTNWYLSWMVKIRHAEKHEHGTVYSDDG